MLHIQWMHSERITIETIKNDLSMTKGDQDPSENISHILQRTTVMYVTLCRVGLSSKSYLCWTF